MSPPTNDDELRAALNYVVDVHNIKFGTEYKVELLTTTPIITTPKPGRLLARLAMPLNPTKNSVYAFGGEWFKESQTYPDGTDVVVWQKGSPIKYHCKTLRGHQFDVASKSVKHLLHIKTYDEVKDLIKVLAEQQAEQRVKAPITRESLDTWE